MRIDNDIHLVASGAAGFDLTDRYDCNAFLIGTGSSWLMFDAGAGRAVESVAAEFAAGGVAAPDIGHLFLTHAHADHSGGAAALARLTGARVLAGAATARMVEAGDETALGLAAARARGIYPEDYAYSPCRVDGVLGDGDVVRVGGASVRAIATPGHSADHFSYLVALAHRTILVAGDALFAEGKVAIQDIPDCSISDTCQSIRRLAELDFDALLPGHYHFGLRGARRHVEAAMGYIERGLCPPSLF